jgi:hypothetical protein
VHMIPSNFIKCYYCYYLDSNCLHPSGCVPNQQFRPYPFKLLCFGGFCSRNCSYLYSPQRPGQMCERHRSDATFFRPLAPRNPDLRFQVNRPRNSQHRPARHRNTPR